MRPLDGFSPSQTRPFRGFSPAAARPYRALVRALGHGLHVEVDGVEHVPAGRALLVANHAFGWDVAFPMEAISRATGRDVWALGEHLWWKVPGLRRIAAAVGVVDGTRSNAEELLAAEQIVVVLPGGLREAVKPRELRYQLLWGHRYGFIDVAVRAGAPILPLACVGADELFDFVGDAYARGKRWLHTEGLPIPVPSRVLPIPHRVALRYVIGEPLSTRGVDPDDDAARRRLRLEVEGALHELIEVELARRAGLAYP